MRIPKRRNVVIAVILLGALVAVALMLAQDQDTLRVRAPIATGDAMFPDYLGRLLGDPLSTGDRLIVHTNGDHAFPAMLAAIDRAQRRISFETYIYGPGDIAHRFTTALAAAARRGVTVQIVLDSVGSSDMTKEDIELLEAAGCHIGWFNPLASYSFEEANYRTHRKALVIDGTTAFVGGIGIADQWLKDIDDQRRWRDTQVEIRGEAAANVEAAFNENWIETGGVVEPDVQALDPMPAGQARSIVVWSSPQGGTNNMKLLYLLAIASARQTIDIQSPYLITDESSQWSLSEARSRGVRVRLLVEGDVTDAKPVKAAGRADYEHLLELGIDIYEYQPAMMHTKAMTVDGVMSIVGSANFDNRSLELNDELNVAAFDSELAARLREDFERDITASTRIELDAWRSRPITQKIREFFWGYFGELF